MGMEFHLHGNQLYAWWAHLQNTLQYNTDIGHGHSDVIVYMTSIHKALPRVREANTVAPSVDPTLLVKFCL